MNGNYEDKTVIELDTYTNEELNFFIETSYELNTQLNFLYSSIQLLDKLVENNEINFGDTYKKYNFLLNQNCLKMIKVLNNITSLIEFEIGIINPNFKNYNIISIFEDTMLAVLDFIKQKHIKIEFNTKGEEYIIKCDANMIERVFINLLSNAIKFLESDSHICVDISMNKIYIKIKIKYKGKEIQVENEDSIFEKYKGLNKSLIEIGKGSNLGLLIVKSIIDIHKGYINIKDEIESGKIITILLPNIYIQNEEVYVHEIDNYKVKLELSDIDEFIK